MHILKASGWVAMKGKGGRRTRGSVAHLELLLQLVVFELKAVELLGRRPVAPHLRLHLLLQGLLQHPQAPPQFL